MSIKSIVVATVIAGSIFTITPSTHEVTRDMNVHFGSTVNQLVLDAAKAENIDVNSLDLNESRDITLHNTGVEAGNLRPGSVVTVTVVYRK